MDFTWVANDVGDITAVTAGTGITGGGTSGAVTVSFDQANYGGGQFAAGKNKIINGDFTINQRAFTSLTLTGALSQYGFDRWRGTGQDGTVTYTPQPFTVGAAPVAGYEATNFARIVTSGQTASNAIALLAQPIEDVRTFANQTVTVSFWAKAATGTPKVAIELDQQFGSGGSTRVTTYGGQVTLSTSWARYSITAAVPSISGKTIGTSSSLVTNLWVSAGSTLDSRTGTLGIQSGTFDFWGVQVEAGSIATPFQTATGTIQGELAACQRYYERLTAAMVYEHFGVAQPSNSTTALATVYFKVSKRSAVSSSVDFSTLGLYDTAAIQAISALSMSFAGINSATVSCTSTGLTTQRFYQIMANNSTSAYIGFSAEL
jgi:hypothetical protein